MRTHHPNRWGNRLYVPLWGGGFSIVDITDLKKPRTISHFDYHPAYSYPTHTALPVGHKILGRDWLVVFDEAVGRQHEPSRLHVGIRYYGRNKTGAGGHVPGFGEGKAGVSGKDGSAHISRTNTSARITWFTLRGFRAAFGSSTSPTPTGPKRWPAMFRSRPRAFARHRQTISLSTQRASSTSSIGTRVWTS